MNQNRKSRAPKSRPSRSRSHAFRRRMLMESLEERRVLDAAYHAILGGALAQDWTNTGLITANNNWDAVPSIIGYSGSDLTGTTDVNPQAVVGTAGPVTVAANQTDPSTLGADGIAEFEITDPVVALKGSETADAPYLLFHVDSTGVPFVRVQFDARDIDGSNRNAAQQIAVQYRVGDTGDFLSGGAYIADATEGPSLDTKVTPVSVVLPVAAGMQGQLQIRIITTNAGGNDEWVGIDNIVIGQAPNQPPQFGLSTGSFNYTQLAGPYLIDTTGASEVIDLDSPNFEGGTLTIELTLDGDANDRVEVRNQGTAAGEVGVSGSDITYGGTVIGTFTGNGGAAPLVVTFNADATPAAVEAVVENITYYNVGVPAVGVKTLRFTLTDGDGGTAPSPTIDIFVEAAPTIAIGAASVTEGNSGDTILNFPITLSATPNADVVVTFNTADGTATVADGDYDAVSNFTVTFPAGTTTLVQNVSVVVKGDNKYELAEQFTGNITATNAIVTTGVAPGIINNDDAVPTLSINDVTLVEGLAGTTAFIFTVTLSNPSSLPVTLNYATADGTATVADNDYQATSGTLTFPADTTTLTQTITVLVNGDNKFELDDAFFVNLSASTNAAITDGQGLGTITNDDASPTASINNVNAEEGDAGLAPFTFTVTLSNPSYLPVLVNYNTSDGTATLADNDYQATSGTLTFPADTTALQQNIVVNVVGDLYFELDETFFVDLTTPNATSGVGTIQSAIPDPIARIDANWLAPGSMDNGVADTFRLVLNGPNFDLYINDTFVQAFPVDTTTEFRVLGSGDNDTLIVDNSGGLILPPISYDGAGGTSNTLQVIGDPGIAGLRGTAITSGPTSGEIVLDADGAALGTPDYLNGNDQHITYTNLTPVDVTTPTAQFDVYGTAAADAFTIDNGPIILGFRTLRVDTPAMEEIRFANVGLLTISGLGSNDTFVANFTASGMSVPNLEIYGHVFPGGVAPADDDSSDILSLLATTAAVTTSFFGQGGDDGIENVGVVAAPTYNLGSVQGIVNFDGGTGVNDSVALSDRLAFVADTNVVLTNNQISGLAPAVINYVNTDFVFMEATWTDDIINILSTQLGTSYLLTGDGGSDTVTIGNTAANFGVTGGSLDAILGEIYLLPDVDLITAGTNDVLNIDASGTAALAGAAFIEDIGDYVYTVGFNGTTVSGPTTELRGFAPAAIRYLHGPGAGTSPLGTAANRLETLNVRGSMGDDEINVLATTAIIATNLDSREGNDVVNITGDTLSGENLFEGFDGNDLFTLSIAANIGDASFAPVTGLTIAGNGNPAADSNNRDRLTIDETSTFFRGLNYDYLDTQGDLDITPQFLNDGLFGSAGPGNIPLHIRTMETLVHNSTGNTDVVVTGTSSDDVITVAMQNTNSGRSAQIFLNGNPYLEAPPATLANNLPGVAGGGQGVDILLNNVLGSTILTLDGSGTSGTGNRAIVQTASENDLVIPGGTNDIFGFGVGVLVRGFGVGNAYDEVDIRPFSTNTIVESYNNLVGSFPAVEVVSSTFTNGTSSNSRAGLIVNGGDEAVAQANGISDQFFVVPSPFFNIEVNGNLPELVLGPDGLPIGDELVLFSPTSFSIWSDVQTPPNVTIVAGNNPFGVISTSIERTLLFPGNGVINLIGDNNDPAVDQRDKYVVVGRDVIDDFGLLGSDAGYQEMTVSINGSAPILIDGAQFLNTYGFDLQGVDLTSPGIAPQLIAGGPKLDVPVSGPEDNFDTLDIRAYADDTPRGWGVDVSFNEGFPDQTDGDLIIYRTSLFGGAVSERIVVQPSGPDAGEIVVTNLAFGTPIVDIDYVGNTDIIFIDDDGFTNDTDTLTLRGTNPDTLLTSGNDTFDIDFTRAGADTASALVKVTDTASGLTLYNVRNITGFGTVNFETLDGTDNISLRSRAGVNVNLDGGNPVTADTLTFIAEAGARITQGVDASTGFIDQAAVGQINYRNFAQLVVNSLTANSTLIVRGTDDNDTIAVQPLAAPNQGRTWVNDGPIVDFNIANNNIAAVTLQGRFGADTFSVLPIVGVGLNIDGGDPISGDTVTVGGTTGDNNITYTPATSQNASVLVAGFGLIALANVSAIALDGQGGNDTLTIVGTAADDSTFVQPTGVGTGSFVSSQSPAFTFRSYSILNLSGEGGFDTVSVTGTNNGDNLTSTASSITLGATINFGAGVEHLEVNALDGDDNINLGALTAVGGGTVTAATVYGGAGNDTLIGTPNGNLLLGGIGNDVLIGGAAIDILHGEAGNDVLIGGAGNDFAYGGDGDDRFGDPLAGDPANNDAGNDFMDGGAGSDTFVWDPGDGSDTIEGGGGESDILIFNGSVGAELFTATAVGNRLVFTRNLGNITMNLSDVENLTLNLLGGGDNVTVNDLTATHLKAFEVNAGAADTFADTVTVLGTQLADQLDISAVGTTGAVVTGLTYSVAFNTPTAAEGDALVVNGRNGNDTISASTLPAGIVNLTLLGGEGNDTLTGSAGNDIVNGGAGDDFLRGGAGDDTLFGEAGEDTFVGGAGNDTIDGGDGFDTILVEGSSANDRIDVLQVNPTTLQYEVSNAFTPGVDGVVGGAGTETDTLVVTATLPTVENVRVASGAGDDILRVTQRDSLIANAEQVFSLRVTVEGGATGNDRLNVVDDGLGDTTIHRVGATAGTGSYQIGSLAPVVYSDVEFAQLTPIDPVQGGTGVDGAGRLFVFKPDLYEENNSRLNATFLGSGAAINVDPTIDPGFDGLFNAAGDEDWYRIVAEKTGTLDIRAYFNVTPATLANGRAGLPGNGDLDIALYDADGSPGPIAGTGAFGTVDQNDDERIRIPVVEGQTYYLRVKGAPLTGASAAINVYNLSILNEAAPVPFDLELDDVIGLGTAAAAVANGFSANNAAAPTEPLSSVDDFYVGKYVTFTSGTLLGQRALVTGYAGATRTFTFAANAFTAAVPAGSTFQVESVDTGRSQFDNTTRDNTPTIFIRVPDSVLLNDIPDNGVGAGSGPGVPPDNNDPATPFISIPHVPSTATNAPSAGFRVAVFVTENNTHTLVGYAQPVAGQPGVYTFTFTTPLQPDRSYFISSRIEMIDPSAPEQNQGYGAFSQSLEIIIDTVAPPVFFGNPTIVGDGLHPNSDTGVLVNPDTYTDGITSDATPTFWGRAEANAVIRLYADLNANGVIDPTDVLIAQTVAEPLDGTNQFPGGYWEATSFVNLNDPLYFPTVDGLRRILVTAEDLAGNVGPSPDSVSLDFFLDTQGPVVTDVYITANPTFDLFAPKPSVVGPTPLVRSLSIDVKDLPARVAQFLYEALDEGVAETGGNYLLRGDFNGIIPIKSVTFLSDTLVAGQPATGTIVLEFFTPLPDDRFTLTISDHLVDPAGNNLDGETNGDEPNGNPDFIPNGSGDGQPGGDFVVRFTVDSRAEIGTWAATSVWVDTNGNGVHDPASFEDYTNRDITYMLGNQPDTVFAGNFSLDPVADGFDKVATYGPVGGQYRFLVDVDHDGVPDNDPGANPVLAPGLTVLNINGLPVAGRFDNSDLNGDEVGVFDGSRWWFDTNHNFVIDSGDYSLASNLRGYAVVGDFDGDGFDDLATWKDDHFQIDLARGVRRGWDGNADFVIRFGFPGVRERPVAADMNGDGMDDLGLWVPDRVSPQENAEWYMLLSHTEVNALGAIVKTPLVNAALPANHPGHRVQIDPVQNDLVFNFDPTPFGDDLYFSFGDAFAQPVIGNFDPPLTPVSGGSVGHFSNPNNPLDVNADGFITPTDAVLVINNLNSNGTRTLTSMNRTTSGPFYDVSGDQVINALDAVLIINHLNASGSGEAASQTFAITSSASGNELSVVETTSTATSESSSGDSLLAPLTVSSATADNAASTSVTDAVEEATTAVVAPLALLPLAAAYGDEYGSAAGSDADDELEDLIATLAADVVEFWK